MRPSAPLVLATTLGLFVGAAWMVARGEPPTYDRVPAAGNTRVRRIERLPSEPWSVQILADIQDGFLYLPRILSEGRSLGVDAVVVAGDLARGGGGDHLSLLLRQLELHPPSVPLFVVPGNHDTVRARDRERFVHCFGAAEFEFEIGQTRFIGLDSTVDTGPAQVRQVARQLANARRLDQGVVVVRHHSPLPSDDPGENTRSSPELARLLTHSKVRFVVSGHAHSWQLDQQGDTRFLIAPASGDRSHGQGQTPISFLILRWTGTRLELERYEHFRSNWIELTTAFQHVFLGHVTPGAARLLSQLELPGRLPPSRWVGLR